MQEITAREKDAFVLLEQLALSINFGQFIEEKAPNTDVLNAVLNSVSWLFYSSSEARFKPV